MEEGKNINRLKCPACGHECPLIDAEGVPVKDPKCPKCFRISNQKISMVEIDADGNILGGLENVPVLSGKDMNTLLYLLLNKVGTIEIPQEVFEDAPKPEILKIEMQWDDTNKIWRFFNKRKRKKRKNRLKLVMPRHAFESLN